MSSTPRPIAYLISRYPAVSHTFIQREIESLTAAGFSIIIASINNPDITSGNKPENIFYVKEAGFIRAVIALFFLCFIHPLRLIGALLYIFQLAGFDLKALLYHTFYLGEAAIVGKWMKEHDSTHLHVHFANPASTVALLVSKLYPFSFSITVHGPDEFYDVNTNNLVRKFNEASFICCIGFYARSQIMRLIPPSKWSKIEITPMGVDPNEFTPINFREKPSPFNIICIGRLTKNKGQHILLEALSKIVKNGSLYHLYLIGDGPDKHSLKATVSRLNLEDHVTFTGPLSQDKIKPILEKSDLFVLPSFAEGIPVSLMEAMSMEIACITSNINGIPELIVNDMNGVLLHPSDVDGLVNAVQHIYQNNSLRRQLGLNARKTILKSWTLETNVKLIAKVFEKYDYL